MAQLKIRTVNVPIVSSAECLKATRILECARDSASSLLDAFEVMREKRARGGRPRGMTTDEEQDLLRAMLIMAAAGVDAMVKQLIRDSLPRLVGVDPEVREGVEKFAARQIRGEAGGGIPEVHTGRDFMARVLVAESQQSQVIEEYIAELTSGSLQSPKELARTATALGIGQALLGPEMGILRQIFDIRNAIVHGLDINLQVDRRIRNVRKAGDMVRFTNALLQVAERVRDSVDEKLRRASPPSVRPTVPVTR